MNVTALQTIQLQEEVNLLLPRIRAVYSPLTRPRMLKAPEEPGRLDVPRVNNALVSAGWTSAGRPRR
jgi:hypothetical protein